jgi:hypothetical protein
MRCKLLEHRQNLPLQAARAGSDTLSMDKITTDKARDPMQDEDAAGPQTFQEALEFAIRALTGSASGLDDDWLAALDREKGRSQAE